jgi:hypothetical protein
LRAQQEAEKVATQQVAIISQQLFEKKQQELELRMCVQQGEIQRLHKENE